MRVPPLTFASLLVLAAFAGLLAWAPTVAADGCEVDDPDFLASDGTGTDGFDDVEAFTSFGPDRCFYTYSATGGNAYVTDTESISTPNSILVENGADVFFLLDQEPLCYLTTGCDGTEAGYQVKVKLTALPESGQTFAFSFGGCSGTNTMCIRVNSLGAVTAFCDGSSSGTSATLGGTLAAGAWYTYTMSHVVDVDTDGVGPDVNDPDTCSGAVRLSESPNTLVGAFQLTAAFNSGANSDDVRLAMGTGASDFYVDDLVGEADLAPPSIGAAVVAPMATNVDGFDVDPSGTTAVARHADEMVRVYGAQNLVEVNAVETECNMLDGVAAYQDNVAYFNCSPVDSRIDELVIASNTLGAPTYVADNCGEADAPLVFNPPDAVQELFFEVKTFQLYSIDFEQSEQAGPNCFVQAVIGLSTVDGRVGAAGLQVNSIGDDELFAVDLVQFSPIEDPVDHICAVVPSGATPGNYLIAAADELTTTKLYDVDVDDGEVSQVANLGGTYGNAIGVGCGRSNDGRAVVLIGTDTQILAFDRLTGQPAWPAKPLVNPPNRGVAMSFDGEWGAFVDDGYAYILNMTSGNVTAQAQLPAGTFREIRLSTQAQSMWVATTQNLARYDIYTYTTGVPVDDTPLPVDSFTNTGTGSTDGFGGGAVSGLSTKMAIYFSAATVAGFALVGWAIVGRRRKVS